MRSSPSLLEGSRLDPVPLHRQPPIWLMLAVVLATLVASTVHSLASPFELGHAPVAFMVDAPAVIEAAAPATVRTLPAPSTPTPIIANAAAVETVEEKVSLDDDELEPCPAPCADRPRRRATGGDSASGRPPERSAAISSGTPSQPLTKATAACRDGDKRTALSTYRAIPIGDSRRKEIRKACRREGMWIL